MLINIDGRQKIVDENILKDEHAHKVFCKLREFWLGNLVESEAKLPYFLTTFSDFLVYAKSMREKGRVHIDYGSREGEFFNRRELTKSMEKMFKKKDE